MRQYQLAAILGLSQVSLAQQSYLQALMRALIKACKYDCCAKLTWLKPRIAAN